MLKINLTTLLLAMAMAGAASFAVFRGERVTAPAPTPRADTPDEPLDRDPEPQALPPNHPPVGASPAPSMGEEPVVAPSELAPAIRWRAPAAWPPLRNPSSMRIATLKVPHAAGDTEDGDLSIARAGGDVESNIERWIEQLGGGGKAARNQRTIADFRVSIVAVDGSYQGMGPSTGPRPGWSLLGAIIETPEEPYFFKLTGPAATVHAARASFDALLDSITPI